MAIGSGALLDMAPVMFLIRPDERQRNTRPQTKLRRASAKDLKFLVSLVIILFCGIRCGGLASARDRFRTCVDRSFYIYAEKGCLRPILWKKQRLRAQKWLFQMRSSCSAKPPRLELYRSSDAAWCFRFAVQAGLNETHQISCQRLHLETPGLSGCAS